MKVKFNIIVIAIVLAIIVFGISTFIQKKLIKYEATTECLVLVKDINENEKVSKDSFKTASIPISIIAMQKVVTNFEDIEGLYARDNIKSGQIAVKSQFDTRENLSLYEAEAGKEKLSIKIKSAENGMSYQIKEKSKVNIYATLRNEYANYFSPEKERLMIGDEFEGYTIIKLLDGVEVLGAFNSDGLSIEDSEGESIDSILIAVNPNDAKEINLIREICTFNITGISSYETISEKSTTSYSGDENNEIIFN